MLEKVKIFPINSANIKIVCVLIFYFNNYHKNFGINYLKTNILFRFKKYIMKYKPLIFFIFLFIIQRSLANSINLVEVFDDYDVIKKDDSTADNITVCLNCL